MKTMGTTQSAQIGTKPTEGCTKRRYAEQALALANALYYQEIHGNKLYSYPCDACKGWHLTTKRKKNQLHEPENKEKENGSDC